MDREQTNIDNTGTRPPATRTRKRPSRVRIIIWVIELAVLLAVTEHVLIRPRWERRRQRPDRPQAAAATPSRIAPVPALGMDMTPLAGLVEVVPAYRITPVGLAPGSDAMARAQAQFGRENGLPVEVENRVGMVFRLVPPGTAMIGSPPGEAGRGPMEVQHVRAFALPFYMGKFEVTQAQWRRVMGASPFHFTGDHRPVEEVTWYDCQRFTVALCERDGVPVGTYRLPTEAEWEYACRAGTQTAYCFGDDPAALEAFADYERNNYHGTAIVGRRYPNGLGLYDMHGNVWEWCLDIYGLYPGDPAPPPKKERWRSLRGGNWYEPAENCRSANRCRLPPLSQGNMLGLRVLRTLPEWSPPEPAPAPSP